MSAKGYYGGQQGPPQNYLAEILETATDGPPQGQYGPPPGQQAGYYGQGPQQGYGQQPQYGGYQQQPQMQQQPVYIQQQPQKSGGSGAGSCCACLAGACLCCCAEEALCDCLF